LDHVLTELRNRDVADSFIVCCDGLKGLPESIRATWPSAEVQLCVVHLVRSSLRYTSKKHWGQVCREMREIDRYADGRFVARLQTVGGPGLEAFEGKADDVALDIALTIERRLGDE